MSGRELERLPVFLLRDEQPPAPQAIAVDGLVERPCLLAVERIRALPAVEFTADFVCEEGWRVPGLRWRGVRLTDLLALVGPLPSAQYVCVGSGGFVATMPLAQVAADPLLLAYELDGKPLPAEHGGPLRLVAPWTACYQSVKWIDRIELAADARTETASTIARARIATEGAQRG